METIKQYWTEVDSFFDGITPKCEKCKAVEEKIHFPLRFALMGVCVLLLVVFYLFTRKCGFFTYCVFFPALLMCMKSINDKKDEEKKWAAFWFVFAVLQMLPKCFEKNIYYALLKFAGLVYLAFFDDCSVVLQSFTVVYGYLEKFYNMYIEKCCKKECCTSEKECCTSEKECCTSEKEE